jgi:hypothetical protein
LAPVTMAVGGAVRERKQQVLELIEQTGKLVERSIREARRLIVGAPARGRGANAKLRQINKLEMFIERVDQVTEQIRKRVRGSGSPTGSCRSSIPTPRPFATAN